MQSFVCILKIAGLAIAQHLLGDSRFTLGIAHSRGEIKMNISETIKKWPVIDGWSIAPSGLLWIKQGYRIQVGDWCTLGNKCTLGDGCKLGDECRLGDGCTNPIDIGFYDYYRKTIANVNGVAYIGAGCRWFTLDAAIKHWGNKPDRITTFAAMQFAKIIADNNGWKHG